MNQVLLDSMLWRMNIMIIHENIKCKRNFGDLHEKLTDKTTRKSIGMFYTPDFVIDYILKYTVEKIDILQNPYVNILDPSCGAGYFLIKAYEILKYKFEKNIELLRKKFNDKNYWCKENIPYHIIKNCLYGVDIDPIAVKIAKKNLLNISTEISSEDINILQCDSLIKWEEHNIPKEYIKDNYPKLKKFWNREFDYIIGNPPYGVLLKSKTDEKYWNYITNNYKTIGYKKNKFYLFIERALEKLKKQGFHGFIIPDRYFLSNSYIESRKNLLQNTKVMSITQLSGKIFKEVIVGTAIYIVQKTGLEGEHKINLKLDYINEKNFNSVAIDQNYINIDKKKKYIINILTKKEYINIMEKIENRSQELKTFCNVHVGMMIKDKDDHFRYSRFKNEKNKIVVGRDLGKYIIENEDRYCCLENIEIFGGTKNIEKHFSNPKILLRKTGKHLIASIDKEGIISEQSIYMIIPFSSDKVYSILGQVQSKLCDFYFRKTLITNPNAYPYIQHYDVKRLPINPDILYNSKYSETIKEIISIKESMKNLELSGKEDYKYMLQTKLVKCIKENNLIVYKYYGLEKEEIDLIENETIK
jgi:type I restriction-modification system DNA methylase subunit